MGSFSFFLGVGVGVGGLPVLQCSSPDLTVAPTCEMSSAGGLL